LYRKKETLRRRLFLLVNQPLETEEVANLSNYRGLMRACLNKAYTLALVLEAVAILICEILVAVFFTAVF
jgi:hypothetical protein